MAWVIETLNPFAPLDSVKHEVTDGISLRTWVSQRFPLTGEFPQPTICLVNGVARLRGEWAGCLLASGDIVNFVTVPQGPTVLLIVTIVIAVASIVVSLVLPVPKPAVPGEGPASDPVFTTKGQSNSIRLGEPIEVSYGRNRLWPSYASRPYFEYRDNDQYQFALFCLGVGEYEVEEIRIGDTLLDSFQEVEYEIVPPAGTVSLFPTNVYTSAEAGGQKLPASNEDDYPAPDGWIGPFVANPSDTEATELHLDLVFPKGLYHAADSGTLEERSVQVEIQARAIDADGDPVGDWIGILASKKIETYVATRHTYSGGSIYYVSWTWDRQGTEYALWGSGDPAVGTVTTEYSDAGDDDPTDREGVVKTVTTILAEDEFLTISAATTTPQRQTYRTTLTPGRYEVRMRRADQFDDDYRSGHEVEWDGMRAYLTDEPDFGEVSLLALKIRATNNLNVQTQQQVNVLCTRKLRIRDSGGGWSPEPIASRSLIWALVDVFRGAYGGGLVDDEYFDWETLEALDDLYESRGDHFDWCFRDPITVWEAARTIARVGRAVPLLNGSLITVKRDDALAVPVTLFGMDNIVKDSFQWEIKLWDLGEYDSARMEYIDPDTSYKTQQVMATLPGGTTDSPQDVRLVGCQARTRAYREGLYLLAQELYQRENITFETGLEGYIPSYGDLIAFSHDVPNWGTSGYVVNASHVASDWYQLWLSEPVNFDESATHQILLRTRAGGLLGPFEAHPTTSAQQVAIQSDESEIEFLLGGTTEPTLFIFGTVTQIQRYWKVVKVEPQGGDRIRITAVNTDDRVFGFDGETAPALGSVPTPPQAPELPTITELRLTQIPGVSQAVQVSWTAAFGALYYVVQTSEDGDHWQERGTTTRTSLRLDVRPGDLWVRVAAVNAGQGAWVTETLTVGFLSGLEIYLPWAALEWGVRWWEVLGADGYQIKVYQTTSSDPVLMRTVDQAGADRDFAYDYADALADGNVNRDMLATVDATFSGTPTGQPVSVELNNAMPHSPTNPAGSFIEEESAEARYLLSWTVPLEDDLHRLVVWLSETDGFDPSTETPYLDEVCSPIGHEAIPNSAVVAVPLDGGGAHAARYWRVAVFDVWGDEIGGNTCGQQTIPAYP